VSSSIGFPNTDQVRAWMVCGGHDVGAGFVNGGMNVETCGVDGKLSTAFSHIPLWVDENMV
jgi:hypothetical protein